MNFSNLLQKFNFTEHEIAIYELLLKSPNPISVKEISHITKIHLATVYRILQRFLTKGYVDSQMVSNIATYSVKVMNEIKPFMIMGEQNLLPNMEYFFGMDDIKKMYEHTITGADIFAFVNIDNLDKQVQDFVMNSYVPDRAMRNTSAYVIASPFSFSKDYAKDGTKYLRSTKICNQIFDYGEINIYGDYVAIISARAKQPIGMRMKNPFFANAMRSTFDLSWNML